MLPFVFKVIEELSSYQPQSICILRLSALGDITHMLPVVRSLMHAYPDCHITWIIGKTEFALVDGLENINFITFDKSKGRKAYKDLKRQLHGERFDVLLHMQAALRASLISRIIKAPIKIGFDRQRAADYQWLFSNKRIAAAPNSHVLDGFFGFIEALGVTNRIMRWDPPIPTSAIEFAKSTIPTGKRTLVINPCSSVRKNNFRNWHAKHYAAVVEHTCTTLDAQVVLTGGPSEVEQNMAQEIASISTSPVIDLVGKTSIKQMLAVLSVADAIIAPDTGPLHMGTAVRTPVIGLYATSNPFRTGPYNDLEKVINAYPKAVEQEFGSTVSDIKWGKRVRNPNAMDLIQVEQVTQELEKIIPPI